MLSQLSYVPMQLAEAGFARLQDAAAPCRACQGEVRLSSSGKQKPGFAFGYAAAAFVRHPAAHEDWAWLDSNQRPRPYQGRALAN